MLKPARNATCTNNIHRNSRMNNSHFVGPFQHFVPVSTKEVIVTLNAGVGRLQVGFPHPTQTIKASVEIAGCELHVGFKQPWSPARCSWQARQIVINSGPPLRPLVTLRSQTICPWGVCSRKIKYAEPCLGQIPQKGYMAKSSLNVHSSVP